MFCPNCGKEIKDDAEFCGFCGQKVVVEENTTPVSVEEAPAAQPVETTTPEAKSEPVETAAPKVEVAPKQPNEFAEKSKELLSNVKTDEFKVLIDCLKDPVKTHNISIIPTAVVLALFAILNMIFLGNIVYGLLISVVIAGIVVLLEFLCNKKEFNILKALSEAAQVLVLPTILTLFVAIFFRLGAGALSSYDYSAMSRAGNYITIAAYLIMISVMIFFVVVIKKYHKLNTYVLTVILLVFSFIVVRLVSSSLVETFSSLFYGLY